MSKCDFCKRDLTPQNRGGLKGLCRGCSAQLESGKASARIVKQEMASMRSAKGGAK